MRFHNRILRQDSDSSDLDSPSSHAPECLTRLRSLEVDKGFSVKLSVIITGIPTPTVVWTCDDDIISEDDHYYFEEDDSQNKYTLVITKIRRIHEGTYRCIAENSEGRCSTMGFITVKELNMEHYKRVSFEDSYQKSRIRRKKRISRKPCISTILEWKSQEEKDVDHEQDTYIKRNKHCWDWWNEDAISDNDDVFLQRENTEKNEVILPRADDELPRGAACSSPADTESPTESETAEPSGEPQPEPPSVPQAAPPGEPPTVLPRRKNVPPPLGRPQRRMLARQNGHDESDVITPAESTVSPRESKPTIKEINWDNKKSPQNTASESIENHKKLVVPTTDGKKAKVEKPKTPTEQKSVKVGPQSSKETATTKVKKTDLLKSKFSTPSVPRTPESENNRRINVKLDVATPKWERKARPSQKPQPEKPSSIPRVSQVHHGSRAKPALQAEIIDNEPDNEWLERNARRSTREGTPLPETRADAKARRKVKRIVHQVFPPTSTSNTNLDKFKSSSLPDITNGIVENKYRKLKSFWETFGKK